MSLWHCEEHGLVGPTACCQRASLASITEISASVPPAPPPPEISENVRVAFQEAANDPRRKRADRAFNATALEVLCRVFDDGADVAMDEWREWYKPEGWLSARRALGAFIRQRIDRQTAALRAREREALDAHSRSVAALASVSRLTSLGGEVDEYDAIPRAVESEWSALRAEVAATKALIRWWDSAGLVPPFTPDGNGGNDGIVRDASGSVIADCRGYEARADVIAELLNRAARSSADGEDTNG